MADEPTIKLLVLSLDLLGTFVFALSGAVAAVRHRLDVFGVLALAFVAATAGGILRDLFIGAAPPASISDWRYLAASQAAAVVALLFTPALRRLNNPVQVFDAAGLALFAVAGAQKALAFGLNPLMAALLGMLTGIGGGMARDLFLAQIPRVLRSEIYAVAALAGAGVVVVGHVLHLPSAISAVIGAALCFGLRLFALRHGWRLPVTGAADETAADDRS